MKESQGRKGGGQSIGGEGKRKGEIATRDRCEAIRRNNRSEQWKIGRKKSNIVGAISLPAQPIA